MSLIDASRRGFLKGACILSAGLMMSVRMVGRVHARVMDIRSCMLDRIGSVYGADAGFPRRASQDNVQVQDLYRKWLDRPLSHLSEEHLHTRWFDKSAALKELIARGTYPNPRAKEFGGGLYTYEE